MRTIRRILPRRTRGFSLVELMVALVIALLVLAATVSFYLMTRSTYTTIEDTSGLEERGQFALNVMTRVLRQAGFTKLSTDNGGIMRLSASDAPMLSGLDGCVGKEAAAKTTGRPPGIRYRAACPLKLRPAAMPSRSVSLGSVRLLTVPCRTEP